MTREDWERLGVSGEVLELILTECDARERIGSVRAAFEGAGFACRLARDAALQSYIASGNHGGGGDASGNGGGGDTGDKGGNTGNGGNSGNSGGNSVVDAMEWLARLRAEEPDAFLPAKPLADAPRFTSEPLSDADADSGDNSAVGGFLSRFRRKL